MSRNRWTALAAIFLSLTLLAAACGSDDDGAAAPSEPAAAEETIEAEAGEAEAADIVATAIASGEFPTLVAAIGAAGLAETLQGEGPFTVFAPTEEAFAAALEALGLTAEELLADPTLADILTYHVVPGNVLAADVVGLAGQDVATVNGATVAIGVDGETVTVNDATVVQTDIVASNGVIHVIDAVLLPPAS